MGPCSGWEESGLKGDRGRKKEMGLGTVSGRVKHGLGAVVSGEEGDEMVCDAGCFQGRADRCADGLDVRQERKKSQGRLWSFQPEQLEGRGCLRLRWGRLPFGGTPRNSVSDTLRQESVRSLPRSQAGSGTCVSNTQRKGLEMQFGHPQQLDGLKVTELDEVTWGPSVGERDAKAKPWDPQQLDVTQRRERPAR